MIYTKGIEHVMTWIISDDYAYTLQSWVDILEPDVWFMKKERFFELIKICTSLKPHTSEFIEAWTELTHVKPNEETISSELNFDAEYILVKCDKRLGGSRPLKVSYENRLKCDLILLCKQRKINVTRNMPKHVLISMLRRQRKPT